MFDSGHASTGRNVENSVDVFSNSCRLHWEADSALKHANARWYYLLKKMNELSNKAELTMAIVDSMERSFDSISSRFEDLEAMVSSVMSTQLAIANIQLDMKMLEYEYLASHTSDYNEYKNAVPQTKVDVRKRSALVVEDNERAAKAAEGTDRKEAIHLNGNAHREGVTLQAHALTQSTFRSRFTIPRVPTTYGGHMAVPNAISGSGDTVDTIVVAPKTKLKSFEERTEPYRQEYYHDARFLQSEASLGSSSELVEKDDEGDHHDDNVNPLLNDMKEKSSMYVQLPHEPQCTDLPPSLQDPLVDQYTNQLPNQSPGKDKKQFNNNKDPEGEVESSCVVDCLYYTLQCCDCSIM